MTTGNSDTIETVEVPADELLDLLMEHENEFGYVNGYLGKLLEANRQRAEEWHDPVGHLKDALVGGRSSKMPIVLPEDHQQPTPAQKPAGVATTERLAMIKAHALNELLLVPQSVTARDRLNLVGEIEHLNMVMRECADAIRDRDEIGALRMLEVCLVGRG